VPKKKILKRRKQDKGSAGFLAGENTKAGKTTRLQGAQAKATTNRGEQLPEKKKPGNG